MKRVLVPLMVGALVVSGVAVDGAMAASRKVKVPEIPSFSPSRDTVTLPANGRGAVGILALPGDPVGPGPEYDALQVMGVPAQVTSIDDDLSRFSVVILAGTADAASVDQASADKLTDFVKSGGSLIAEAATSPALRPLLGIDAVEESQARGSLVLCAGCHPSLNDVTGKAERTIELDDVQEGAGIGTVGYRAASDAQVLGIFNDGWGAVMAHPYGDGVAYTVGARLSDLVTRHLEGARFSAQRGYVNSSEADGDAWLLWLRGVWQNASPGGVTLSTLPAGVQVPVVMTISANWGEGVANTPAYLKTIRKYDSDASDHRVRRHPHPQGLARLGLLRDAPPRDPRRRRPGPRGGHLARRRARRPRRLALAGVQHLPDRHGRRDVGQLQPLRGQPQGDQGRHRPG